MLCKLIYAPLFVLNLNHVCSFVLIFCYQKLFFLLLDLTSPPPPPPPMFCHVFTWGCNDEGALGRDGDEYTPLPVVKLKDHVIRQGDSHTAALTSSECVCTSGVCSG